MAKEAQKVFTRQGRSTSAVTIGEVKVGKKGVSTVEWATRTALSRSSKPTA